MPIWDMYVLKNLGFKIKLGKPLDKIEQAVTFYREINDYFIELLKSEWGKEAIYLFNETIPDHRWISDLKKIDFYIWQIR